MSGLVNADAPLIRMARGAARWLMGLDGDEDPDRVTYRVYTGWGSDTDGGRFPGLEVPVAEADGGIFGVGETRDPVTQSVVPSVDLKGNITVFPLSAFDNPNFTLDGGDYS